MFKMKTTDENCYLVLKNPNDTLDFISSFAKELNNILAINNERTISSVKMLYGSSKKTSDQESEEYKGVKAFATLLKKAISSMGTNGYFTGARDRWKYSSADGENNRKLFKRFDNHIKITFKCKTAKERETLKTLVIILLTFHNSGLNCDICDLDYIEDIEIIKDDMFEFNLYLFARTVMKFEYENNHEVLHKIDYKIGDLEEKIVPVEEKPDIPNEDEVEFENGF